MVKTVDELSKLTDQELREYGREHAKSMGLDSRKFAKFAKRESMLKLLTEEEAEQEKLPKEEKSEKKWIVIEEHAGDPVDGTQDVTPCINGKAYRIQRGHAVELGPEVLEVLDNAIQHRHVRADNADPDAGLVRRAVPRFPYRAASPEEIKIAKGKSAALKSGRTA